MPLSPNVSIMSLRVAIAQTAGRLNAWQENMQEVASLSEEAARQGARLILFPEGAITGNAFHDRRRQDAIPASTVSFAPLTTVAVRRGITICAGFTTPLQDKLNNVFAIVQPDGNIWFQHKCFRSSTEPEFLIAWTDPRRTVFDVDGVRVVISICSEYGVPAIEAAVRTVAPDIILHPSAGCLMHDQLASNEVEAVGPAREFPTLARTGVESSVREVAARGIPKVSANPVGFDGETYWPGNSFIIGSDGQILLWLRAENNPARMHSSVGVTDVPVARIR